MKFANDTYVFDWTNLNHDFSTRPLNDKKPQSVKAALVIQLMTLMCLAHVEQPGSNFPVMEIRGTEMFRALLDSFSDSLDGPDIFTDSVEQIQYNFLSGPRGFNLTFKRNDGTSCVVILLLDIDDLVTCTATVLRAVCSVPDISKEGLDNLIRPYAQRILNVTNTLVFK